MKIQIRSLLVNQEQFYQYQAFKCCFCFLWFSLKVLANWKLSKIFCKKVRQTLRTNFLKMPFRSTSPSDQKQKKKSRVLKSEKDTNFYFRVKNGSFLLHYIFQTCFLSIGIGIVKLLTAWWVRGFWAIKCCGVFLFAVSGILFFARGCQLSTANERQPWNNT